jgi:transcriptional regulator with XRE-family HTH domain
MSDVWDDSDGQINAQIELMIARIKKEREKARLSQMDLALMAGLSQNLVNYIESGRRTPNLHTILKISKVLNIAPSTLFDSSDVDRRAARETITDLVKKYI